MSTYKIISLDGGGGLGVVSARLLQRLDSEVEGLLDNVQLYAGTSIGSFSAVSLALGIPPSWLTEFFTSGLIKLFFLPYTDKGLSDELNELQAALKADESLLKNPAEIRKKAQLTFKTTVATAAECSSDPVIGLPQPNPTTPMYLNPFSLLYKVFGNLIHWEHLDTPVFLGSINLQNKKTDRWQPQFFSNVSAAEEHNKTVTEALLCSTAAPMFYATFQGHIDGWPIVDNPALSALSTVVSLPEGAPALSDVRMMSLGVGVAPSSLEGQTLSWGRDQWLDGQQRTTMICPPLLDLICTQNAALCSKQCRQLMGSERYLRLNVDLQAAERMDNFAIIDNLVSQVDAMDISPYVEWVNKNWIDS